MGVVAAQLYVQGILTGLTPPGATGIKAPITALITPLDPDVNADGVARAYVWPAKGPEKRIAMPRNNPLTGSPGGYKRFDHNLEIFLVWMDNQDDPNKDVNFPLLIDFVMKVTRTTPNTSVIYTDPETGDQSQMVNLGEKQDYEFIPPRTVVPQGMLRYDARITCSLIEIFQA